MSPDSAAAPPFLPPRPFGRESSRRAGAAGGYGGDVSDAARIGTGWRRRSSGSRQLRPGQLEAIEAVLAGRDTLAVMSTGYGKSAIYQLAGEILGKPTIVVSPLIALQRDQVEAIEDRIGGGEAAELNSTVSAKKRHELIEALERGEHEFVLLAPEQLAKPEVLAELAAPSPRCWSSTRPTAISEWGPGFRPDYLQLGAFAERLGRPTILALTATASPPVRREIAERLGMKDPAAGDPRLRPSQPPLRGAPVHRGGGEREGAGRGRRGGGEAGDRLHRDPQGERGAGRGARRGGGQRGGLPRGPTVEATAARCRTASWPTRSR